MTDAHAADSTPELEVPTDALTVERHIAASPSVVYTYLTESDKWARWQGIAAELHPVPGGVFLMSMPNGLQASGRFVELIPERRVVFTWGWVDHPDVPPGSSTVRVDLTPDDDGALVRLTHSGLPSTEIEIHARGWHHYLPRLRLASQGRTPEPDLGPG